MSNRLVVPYPGYFLYTLKSSSASSRASSRSRTSTSATSSVFTSMNSEVDRSIEAATSQELTITPH